MPPLVGPGACATVTNIAWYRFGKNDPGAVNGGVAAGTTNLAGGQLNMPLCPTNPLNPAAPV